MRSMPERSRDRCRDYQALIDAEDISVTDRAEADLDVQAVLKEYLRLEREITDKAKDLLQKRNLTLRAVRQGQALPRQRKELRSKVMRGWSG